MLTGNTKIKLSQILDLLTWRLVDDDKKYNIGEISTKTGLQKCLINGYIVWLLPKQNSNFMQGKMTKSDTKQLAKSTKLARPDGTLKSTGNVRRDATQYLNYMKSQWTKHPVKAPYLNNATIGLNAMSYKHLFETKGKQRSIAEIKTRAECLPYVRDILERTGKPADHTIKNGKESYTIVGSANINGMRREIQVVISKARTGHHYYLSVFNLK